MSKFKICKKCNEKLPATTEYFYKEKGNNDGLRGTCKKCKNRQAKVNARKRREEGRHLIHDLVCDWCSESFKADNREQRFCSTNCQYTWQRESEEYKKIIKNTIGASGNQYGNPKEREQRFKEQFEKLNPNFKYHSEYVGADDNFKSECRVCGYIQERNAQAGRPSSADVKIQCDNCNVINKARKELIEVLNKRKAYLEKQEQKRQRQRELERQRIEKEQVLSNYICTQCHKKFTAGRTNEKYCSDKCKRRASNKRKEIRRRRRLSRNGKIDYSISLEGLYKRDKGMCHICGDMCNPKDYVKTGEGYFIAGNSYPSIDHVVPVSKGGRHVKDNVKLAHRYCNTIKRDKIINNKDHRQLR